MERKLYTLLLISILSSNLLFGKGRDTLEFSNSYLDTVNVEKSFKLNDYVLVGVEYGLSLNNVLFTPSHKTTFLINPVYTGVTFTKYGKMFGYMPYFGIQAGLFYGTQGYKFRKDNATGNITNVNGATQAIMKIVEVPLLAEMHFDMPFFKIIADVGLFGAYRLNIERSGGSVNDNIRFSFLQTDRRFDYGIKGGVGFGIIFSPFEFHIKGQVKYSWGTLYNPDYYNKYYYRFAYPFDVVITAGLHIQLTKRSGKTREQIRKQAYETVFNNENIRGKSR